jgi:ADP-heptose:LPS heptosyltransferase
MGTREDIEGRIRDYRIKLGGINQAIADEMSKGCDRRHINLLHLLYYEKKAHALPLIEMESLFTGSEKQPGENDFSAFGREQAVKQTHAMEGEGEGAQVARRVYRIATYGGIGDSLLTTPAIRALKKRRPDCKIHVYCMAKSHKEVLANNIYIDGLHLIGTATKHVYRLLAWLNLMKIERVDTGNLAIAVFLQRHATEIMGEMLRVNIDDPRPDYFLTKEEEKEAKRVVAMYHNPVAIHVTARCSPNKHWLTENWERLVQNNPNCSFLQLGSADDEPIRGAIDMRGTTVRQAFNIISEAKAFIGVDSVFAHAAAAVKTPAVTLFGASSPAVWGQITSKNLYNPPPCSPCLGFLRHDPCPYGRTCMSNITVSDVEHALSAIIAPAVK